MEKPKQDPVSESFQSDFSQVRMQISDRLGKNVGFCKWVEFLAVTGNTPMCCFLERRGPSASSSHSTCKDHVHIAAGYTHVKQYVTQGTTPSYSTFKLKQYTGMFYDNIH